MPSKPQGAGDSSPRVAIVISTYNAWITERLLDGALAAWEQSGAEGQPTVVEAAGTFEITALCREVAYSGHYDCLVALACVIRGETAHFDYICRSVTHGLTEITLRSGLPIGFGILTCDTKEQAEARAGGAQGNKGEEAMRAALQTVATLRYFTRNTSSRTRNIERMPEHAMQAEADEPLTTEHERRPVTSLLPQSTDEQARTASAQPAARTEADPRLIRQLALLALYQLDARGEEDANDVSQSMPFAGLTLLKREEDSEPPKRKGPKTGKPSVSEKGFASDDLRIAYDLACEAFAQRRQADALMRELAPEWPPERQPTVDRCILRLAYHEMISGRTPPKVAINEAVELAKRFSTDRSPLFINGVLDKVMRRLPAMAPPVSETE